jgi:hypothetical protein
MVAIIVPAVSGAVTITIFVMKRLYKQEMHQTTNLNQALNDAARQLIEYMNCVKEMKEHYTAKFMAESTSEQDKLFYKRLIIELDDNLEKYQRQLNGFIDRITKKR